METDRRAPGGTASVTVQSIRANNHKRCFELETEKGPYTFPYALLPNDIRDEDKVRNVYPDPDIGFAGFEYVLDSGFVDTVHLDSVLWYNADPRYLYDLFLYQLTTAVVDALQDSKLGKRQLIRRLGTSSSQFYRILDTTNYAKSPEQLIALLHILGKEVKFSIGPRTDRAWEELSKSQARPRRRHATSRS